MLPIIREIPPRRPRCRSSFNKGHCSAALWPIKATWLYINCDEFHLLTKIRHPEVRKRASVFFSLQVGPKDLVLEVLIKLIKSKLSHYLNVSKTVSLTFRLRRLRVGTFWRVSASANPKTTLWLPPASLPSPLPGYPTISQFGVGLSHSGRKAPSHLGAQGNDHEN